MTGRRPFARALAALCLLAVMMGTLPAAAEQRFIPLSNLRGGAPQVEMSGEMDEVSFTAVLPPMAPLTQVVLTLVYENGIDILPENSRLHLTLNGEPVAELPMTAFRGPVTASITLPVERLRGGVNRFTVRQDARHRVFCNVRGTFDLWSRINLARSGLRLVGAGPPPPPNLAMLPDLLAASDRFDVPLTLVRPEASMRADQLGWSALVAQAYARALDRAAPRVETRPLPPAARAQAPAFSAKTVVIGTRGDLAGIVPPEALQDMMGPFLGVYPVPGQVGGFMLVVGGRTPQEVDRAVLRLYDLRRPLPPQASLVLEDVPSSQTADAEAPVRSGRLRLAELGFQTLTHSGYRFRKGIDLQLPTDFKPVADSTAALRLDASFDNELGPGAVLNVIVNDRVAGSLDLAERSSGELRHAEIRVLMSAFRPGPNRVEFVAEMAPDREMDCAYVVRRPSFTLYASTELEFPAFARLVSLPDLGLMARTGFPLGPPSLDEAGTPFDLVVVGSDEGWYGAALTMVGRIGQKAGVLLWPVPHVGWMLPTQRNALVVGPVAQLPQAALRNDNVTPAWLSGVLEAGTRLSQVAAAGESFPEEERRRIAERLSLLDPNGPGNGADPAGSPVRAPSAFGTGFRDGEGGDPSSRWARRDHGDEAPAALDSWRDTLLGIIDSVSGFDIATVDRGRGERPTVPRLDGTLPDAALLQIVDSEGARRTWTVLTGIDGATVGRAVDRLVTAPSWSQLDGSTVLWQSVGGPVRAVFPTTTYAVIDDWYDPRNLFLILASLLSRRIGVLFGLLLGTVLVLAFSMHALLRRGRRR